MLEMLRVPKISASEQATVSRGRMLPAVARPARERRAAERANFIASFSRRTGKI